MLHHTTTERRSVTITDGYRQFLREGTLSKRARMAIPDPEERPTISAEEAFVLLGCGRTSGYDMLRAETFPVPVLRLGHKIRIPTAPLLELLGLRPSAGRSDAA
jgi:predicted DNA-binding transcriptional regulator AlpA